MNAPLFVAAGAIAAARSTSSVRAQFILWLRFGQNTERKIGDDVE